MVHYAPGPVHPGPRASWARARSRDLCRGRRREVGPHLFRGRLAARRPWRCRSRSRAALHDGLPPPSPGRPRLGHHWHRHPPLAPAGRSGRFRPADGRPSPAGGSPSSPQPHCRCLELDALGGSSNSRHAETEMPAIRLHPEMTPPRLDCQARTERFELLNPETRDKRGA